MLTLDSIEKTVAATAVRKSDVCMNLQTLTPVVNQDKVCLTSRRGMTYGMVHNGLQSYLSKLEIPTSFFKNCSSENKRHLLEQFHPQKGNQEVMLRLLDDNIRYIASTKYSCFDDIDMIKSLKDTNMNLGIKEFSQTAGRTVLRAVAANPINVPNLRPFYPGIQVLNSEIGESSVRVQFFLWEEVCTNGMLITRGNFPVFIMRHLGRKDHAKLSDAVCEKISGLPKLVEMCESALTELSMSSAEEITKQIEQNENISQKIKTNIQNYIAKYSERSSNPTGLDILSAMTEASQKFSWDERLSVEEYAGSFLAA